MYVVLTEPFCVWTLPSRYFTLLNYFDIYFEYFERPPDLAQKAVLLDCNSIFKIGSISDYLERSNITRFTGFGCVFPAVTNQNVCRVYMDRRWVVHRRQCETHCGEHGRHGGRLFCIGTAHLIWSTRCTIYRIWKAGTVRYCRHLPPPFQVDPSIRVTSSGQAGNNQMK